MGSSKVTRATVAIFGGGRVGTAMSLEMPGVPVVRRGDDLTCDVACVCWPAHAVKSFAATHPLGARARTVAFCNGVWAEEEGMDEQGCCYVRAVSVGDRAKPGYKGWRVADEAVAASLRAAGLGVVRSRTVEDHRAHLWGKLLYILPLALACCELDESAKLAVKTDVWAEWFDVVRVRAEEVVGPNAFGPQVKRALFLVDRLPTGWRPSSSPEELDYFRERICAESLGEHCTTPTP